MQVFEIKNIYYVYKNSNSQTNFELKNISFNVDKEEFVAIVGSSGSGKSTLVTHLNGLLTPTSGEILFNGKNIHDKEFDKRKLRFKVGLLFQYPEYQLFSETVLDDVIFGAIKKGLTLEEAKKKGLEILDILGILELKNESPFSLSGGEKRKVALAGVLVMDPEVLVLDEPIAGLDSNSKKNLFEIISYLRKEKHQTIIMVTHDLDDVMEYTDKVLVLKDGECVKYGKPNEVLTDDLVLEKSNLYPPTAVLFSKEFNKRNIKFYGYKKDDIFKSFYENL